MSNMTCADRLLLIDFIRAIPDAAFDWPPTTGTIYKDQNFRLDRQGKNTKQKGKPVSYNSQVQANKGASTETIRKMAPNTVCPVLHLTEKLSLDPAACREVFKTQVTKDLEAKKYQCTVVGSC